MPPGLREADELASAKCHRRAHGTRAPLKHIHNLVIRPSSDLGRIASDVVGDAPELDLGAFLGMLQRTTGAGTSAKEADLLSYLLFDAAYGQRLIELGHHDAEAHESELAAFFSDPDAA